MLITDFSDRPSHGGLRPLAATDLTSVGCPDDFAGERGEATCGHLSAAYLTSAQLQREYCDPIASNDRRAAPPSSLDQTTLQPGEGSSGGDSTGDRGAQSAACRRRVPKTTYRLTTRTLPPAPPTVSLASERRRLLSGDAGFGAAEERLRCEGSTAGDFRSGALTWPESRAAAAAAKSGSCNEARVERAGVAHFSAPPPTLPNILRSFCDSSLFGDSDVFTDDDDVRRGCQDCSEDEPTYECCWSDEFDVVEHSDSYRKAAAARLHSAPPELPPRPPSLQLPRRQPPPLSRSVSDFGPAGVPAVRLTSSSQPGLGKRRPAGLELWANRIQMGVAARKAWEEKYVIKLGRDTWC